MSGSVKWTESEREHVWHFLHKTRNEEVPGCFWKFHVVVVQNNGKKKNVQKKCAARANFLLIRPIVVFHRWSLPSLLSITRLYVLLEQTTNVIESFAFSPGYIYILPRTFLIKLYRFVTSRFDCSGNLSQKTISSYLRGMKYLANQIWNLVVMDSCPAQASSLSLFFSSPEFNFSSLPV